MNDPLSWLDDNAERRRAAGLRRALRPRTAGSPLIDLASNDYLGLVRHPEVIDGAATALRRWGAGSTGSRLVTGTTSEHELLERELAEFVGAEAGLVFASGYAANLGAVTALAGRDALIVSDAGSHASLVDACRLSRARVVVTPHGDLDAIDRALRDRVEDRALVLTDSVFSADGDLADLVGLHRITRAHGAVLVVDEAHGIGVRGRGGRGLVHEVGLAGEPDIVVTATLSKSLAAQGGVVLGRRTGPRPPDRHRPHLHLRHRPRARRRRRRPRRAGHPAPRTAARAAGARPRRRPRPDHRCRHP